MQSRTKLIAFLFLGLVAWLALPRLVPDFYERVTANKLGNLINLGAMVIVIVQTIRTIDRKLQFNPQRFARDHFDGLVYPWQDTYRSIEVPDRAALDRFVITAGHPQLLEDPVTYGIMVARVADILGGSRSGGGAVRGLDERALLEMLIGQKLDLADHQARMDRLLVRGVRARALAGVLRSFRAGKAPRDSRIESADLEMLIFWLDQSRFQLRIDANPEMQHLASQLSAGYVDIKGSAGHNCLSYMGIHATGEDLPVALVGGDVGDSLGTNMRRGLIYCSGDAGSDVGKSMTGGTIIVGGRPGNRFGHDMDDSTHPSVLVAYRKPAGFLMNETMRNGLILLLNRDVEESPRILRFCDGEMESRTLEGIDAESIYGPIRSYVQEWRETHGESELST